MAAPDLLPVSRPALLPTRAPWALKVTSKDEAASRRACNSPSALGDTLEETQLRKEADERVT